MKRRKEKMIAILVIKEVKCKLQDLPEKIAILKEHGL